MYLILSVNVYIIPFGKKGLPMGVMHFLRHRCDSILAM